MIEQQRDPERHLQKRQISRDPQAQIRADEFVRKHRIVKAVTILDVRKSRNEQHDGNRDRTEGCNARKRHPHGATFGLRSSQSE